MSPRSRLLHSESFRLAAVFALLFLVFAAGLMTSVYWIVHGAQRAALLDAVDADLGTIANGYRAEGFPEAVEVIEQRLGPTPRAGAAPAEEYIILEDAARHRLAGNLPSLPARMGLFELEPTAPGSSTPNPLPGRPRLLGRGVTLGAGSYLFVGRDMRTMAAAQVHLLQAFAWITLAALGMALLGGVLSSLRYMKRIDAIATTCNAIIAGRFSERIALGGSGDELDRLSHAINRMLDRIAMLLENLQQISTDIAHDLRTPLTRLRHRLERAQNSHTSEEYAEAVTRAISEADQMLSMFTALLRIAQIEAHAQARALTEFSLSDRLRELIAIYQPVAEDHGDVLGADLGDGLRVRGDPELLTQLCVNLLENAFRHTPRGTRVRVQLEPVAGIIRLSVSDNGPGIPADEQDKVLRRFYRLSASRSTPGTGLGLALVKAITKFHGAELRLRDNEPGLRVEIDLQGA